MRSEPVGRARRLLALAKLHEAGISFEPHGDSWRIAASRGGESIGLSSGPNLRIAVERAIAACENDVLKEWREGLRAA